MVQVGFEPDCVNHNHGALILDNQHSTTNTLRSNDESHEANFLRLGLDLVLVVLVLCFLNWSRDWTFCDIFVI